MLRMINETLEEVINNSNDIIIQGNSYITKLLDIMEYNIPMTSKEIMNKLGLKSKETLRANYLDPAIKEGLIKLTIPDKPTSKNQMYYKI